jgi:hypothetical protein
LRFRRALAYIRPMQQPSQSERAKRVRIGVTGLGCVFFVVVLGTAVSRSSDRPASAAGNASGLANGAEPDEPLAQIGVAPGQSADDNNMSDNRVSGAARTP